MPTGYVASAYMPSTQKPMGETGGTSFSPAPYTPTVYGSIPNSGVSQGGEVKNLPFAKNTNSMPNLSVLNPAFQQQLGFLSQAAPDYTSYFNQLSNQAFEDANRQSARLAASHGGAPTASTGNTGMNQAAFQGMLFDQLNKANVDRMWTTADQWNQNKYNLGNAAYQNYFNALANRAYDTSEQGFNSGIYQGGKYEPFNPYANTSIANNGGGSNPSSTSFSSPGGSARPGGANPGSSSTGGNPSDDWMWGGRQSTWSDNWNSSQPGYWTLDSYLDELANRELQNIPMMREADDWASPENNPPDQASTSDDPNALGWIVVPGPHESYWGTKASADAVNARYPGTTWTPKQ